MVVVVCLLTLAVLIALVLFNRTQVLQQEVNQLKRESNRRMHQDASTHRLLKSSLDALQNQLLDNISVLQHHQSLTPHELACRHFLIGNLAWVILRSINQRISVHQAVKLAAQKDEIDFSGVQMFINKQSTDTVTAWQVNQHTSYIKLCKLLSRLPAHLAQAS